MNILVNIDEVVGEGEGCICCGVEGCTRFPPRGVDTFTNLNRGCTLMASCGKKSECEAPDVVDGL